MLRLAHILWSFAASIASGAFWMAVSYLSFAATGADPVDLMAGAEPAGSVLIVVAICLAGLAAYAGLSRARFGMDRRFFKGGTHG